MSDHTLRPIWTPEDARQTARDAAKRPAYAGVLDHDIDVARLLNDEPFDVDPQDRPAGRHRAPTVVGMRPRRAVRLTKATIAVAVVILVLALGALWASQRANAEPIPPNCQQQPWLYNGLFGRMTTRTICDGPIQADGSWLRHRNFYAKSYYKPVSCSWGRYSGSCSGGYQVAEFDTGVEEYVVTVDTALPDEPGHLG